MNSIFMMEKTGILQFHASTIMDIKKYINTTIKNVDNVKCNSLIQVKSNISNYKRAK